MRPGTLPRNPASAILLVTVATLAVSFGGCGPSTTIEQAWRAPITQYSQAAPPLQRVVTLFIADSQAMRRGGEDQLARELAARGVEAAPGYALVSDQELEDLEAVKTKVRAMGFDGIVTMRIVDREQTVDWAPGYSGYWGYGGYGWYGGYWGSPGYAYPETIYRIETNAYSLKTNQLVWSALTRTDDPENARSLIKDTTKVIAGQLTERGLAG